MGVAPTFTRAPVPLPPVQGERIQVNGCIKSPEGVPMRLEVQVHGIPEPTVQWFCNDRLIQPDSTHRLFTLPESTHCLGLETPKASTDSGTYHCVASNALGVKELIFPVRIEPRAQVMAVAPKFTSKPGPKIVTPLGEPLVLEAVFEGVPKAVISWHKDGK